MKDWASLPLRLSLGIIFVGHGLQKVFAVFGGPGIKGFSGMLSSLGFAPANLWSYLVSYIELVGGCLLIIGLLTRIASLLIFVVMVVAAITVHLSKGFFLANGGFEYNLLIMCACITLVILGPGKLSITKKL